MVSFSSIAIGCLAYVQLVSGHGFMVVPSIRGQTSPQFKYELQSLGAIGPGGKITICGRGGAINFNMDDKVTKMPAPGSEFTFVAKITAHHYGHMIVRICPFIDSGTTRTDLKKCIRLKDVKGKPSWPLSANTGKKEWTVKLPTKSQLASLGSNVYKGVYTIQWRWNTGNSCTPSEDVDSEQSNCNEWRCCSEVFTNCADVVFDGIDNVTPKPVENPPEAPDDSPPPSNGGSTGGAGGVGCVREEDRKKNAWYNVDTMIEWCKKQTKEDCEAAVQCRWSAGGPPDSNSEPEPSSEAPIPHRVDVTDEARALKFVKQFCDANKDYYCSHKPSPRRGNDICECSPVSEPDNSDGEDKDEPGAKPEDESGNDSTAVECEGFKKWCQKRACNGAVAINQCYGTPQSKTCKCTDGRDHTIRYRGSLIEETTKGTKFSDRVTRQIGVHGEVTP